MSSEKLLFRLQGIQDALKCEANAVATIQVTELICDIKAAINNEVADRVKRVKKGRES